MAPSPLTILAKQFCVSGKWSRISSLKPCYSWFFFSVCCFLFGETLSRTDIMDYYVSYNRPTALCSVVPAFPFCVILQLIK